jgi:predicted transcriptional regulator
LYSYFSLSCGFNIKIVNYNSINMGNRSSTEIVSNILDAANGGTTKTKIMYFAFLSYNQLNEYLSLLIENNLIEYLDGTHKFKTTAKGLNLLKIHNEMAELLQQTTFKSSN